MHRNDDRRAGRQRGKIGGEPLELRCIDAALVGVVVGDADRVEHDEVVALVVEGVISLAEAIFEELLAVERVGGRDAAGGIDAENVVVADRVIDLEAEVLLGLAVEIEELESALFGDAESVKDMVAAVDGEVCLDGAGLFEGHVGADGGVELGLDDGRR